LIAALGQTATKAVPQRGKGNFHVRNSLTFNYKLLMFTAGRRDSREISMLVIIDERQIVTSGYTSRLGSEGVASAGFCPLEFQEWVATAADSDLTAVEAFLLGDCRDRQLYPKMIKERTRAPVIAMNDAPSLEQTLDLFAAGVDDVVRKPIHVREILARVGAIRRRYQSEHDCAVVGELRVFFDGNVIVLYCPYG
jgi:hypothetical protein